MDSVDESTPVFEESWGVQFRLSNGELSTIICASEKWARQLVSDEPERYMKVVRRYVTEWEEVDDDSRNV